MINVSQQHLGADKGENDCQGRFKIDKLVNDTCEQEIQRTQTKDCANVGGVDDKWIARNAEDRWNRVDGERP